MLGRTSSCIDVWRWPNWQILAEQVLSRGFLLYWKKPDIGHL